MPISSHIVQRVHIVVVSVTGTIVVLSVMLMMVIIVVIW